MLKSLFVGILILFFSEAKTQETDQLLYKTDNGHASFVSDAPLELIKAESEELKGVVDPQKRTFAFQLEVKSLQGFNSALQQEHYYENYMETDKYPKASFSGKIIENIDFSTPAEIKIRAKGELNIHGVEKERIINCTLFIREDGFRVTSTFVVLLDDHNISIPKLVYQKIAEEIKVTIETDFYKVD